jgi:hypothetical protein
MILPCWSSAMNKCAQSPVTDALLYNLYTMLWDSPLLKQYIILHVITLSTLNLFILEGFDIPQ